MNYKLFDSEEQYEKVERIQQEETAILRIVSLQLGIRNSVVQEMRNFVMRATAALEEQKTK